MPRPVLNKAMNDRAVKTLAGTDKQTIAAQGFRQIVSFQIFNKPWGPSSCPQPNNGDSWRNRKVLWERLGRQDVWGTLRRGAN